MVLPQRLSPSLAGRRVHPRQAVPDLEQVGVRAHLHAEESAAITVCCMPRNGVAGRIQWVSVAAPVAGVALAKLSRQWVDNQCFPEGSHSPGSQDFPFHSQ